MSHALKEEKAPQETRETVPSPMEVFRERFFAPKVVKNRSKPSPLPQPKMRSRLVRRKLTQSTTTHVTLHIDENTKEFSFTCPLKDIVMPVTRTQIQDSIAEVHNSEWIRMQLGTEVLRLNRADLRVAFNELNKL